ncbi:Rieske (2Fe-2S) protein [Bradyrhizobium sp. STM 3566]|uniref:Rieske (2Fe-2S) protein n=1 Tax=Bradyrhizobium sp. STM 3566 TaxID=578928 RepID=UPI00388D57DB
MSEPIIGNVMSGRTEVFVVCQADAIERSGAVSVSLSQIDDGASAGRFIVVRTFGNDYFGYVNRCPHESVWLNIGCGACFSADRSFLRCGWHGARFEIETGVCIDGP